MITLDFFLQIMYLSCGFAIAFKVFQIIRNMGKVLVLEITPFHYKPTRRKVIDGNKIPIGKDKYTEFTPADITEETKPFWKFWRNPKRMLLLNGITLKVVKWVRPVGRPKEGYKPEDYKKLEMKHNWSLKEIEQFERKVAVKSHEKTGKENWIPIITLLAIFFLAFLIYLGFHRIGAL